MIFAVFLDQVSSKLAVIICYEMDSFKRILAEQCTPFSDKKHLPSLWWPGRVGGKKLIWRKILCSAPYCTPAQLPVTSGEEQPFRSEVS